MSIKKTLTIVTLSIITTTALVHLFVKAGDLNPSSAPGDTMYTLEDIYCKITNCATSSYGIDSTDEATSTMYTLEEIYDVAFGNYYGKGWVASSTGNATTSLTQAACEDASGWVWFEDGNGDGDIADPEDGICVATSTVMALTWNGMDYSSWADNTYLAAYTCAGSFPNGYVASYSGYDSGGAADNTWDDGDCALCQADCYDGRKDLPDQIGQDGAAYPGKDNLSTGIDGPLTSEVLKNWKGTRLPTAQDFFGFCGHKSGTADDASGDSNYYSSGASNDKTLGYYGHNVGRGANGAPYDEYINLSRTSYEWLSEQHVNSNARVAGSYACSYFYYVYVYYDYRFRAVFRP